MPCCLRAFGTPWHGTAPVADTPRFTGNVPCCALDPRWRRRSAGLRQRVTDRVSHETFGEGSGGPPTANASPVGPDPDHRAPSESGTRAWTPRRVSSAALVGTTKSRHRRHAQCAQPCGQLDIDRCTKAGDAVNSHVLHTTARSHPWGGQPDHCRSAWLLRAFAPDTARELIHIQMWITMWIHPRWSVDGIVDDAVHDTVRPCQTGQYW